MSRPQESHRPFFPFGNPFRSISPKGSSYLSPKLLSLLNTFEETLAGRIKNLKPTTGEDFVSLSWMQRAIESLSESHTDIKTLINALEFPVHEWEEKWIDIHLDSSVKLLDICNAFNSEISRMKQGHLFLQHVLHILGNKSAGLNPLVRARSSLDGWKQHVESKNPRLDKCFVAMDGLAESLNLPKVRNSSAKGKVLIRAMYGVKAVTLLICGIFVTTFFYSPKKLMDLRVLETCAWAEAFTDLQTFVNNEIRNANSNEKAIVLKEMATVDTGVEKLYPMVQDGKAQDLVEGRVPEDLKSNLGKSVEKLSLGLDLVSKELDRFFQIVLTGRDALLDNLRFTTDVSNKKVKGSTIR